MQIEFIAIIVLMILCTGIVIFIMNAKIEKTFLNSQANMKELLETQRDFLHVKIEAINTKVFENMKNSSSQIEKNLELFNKISLTQESMNTHLQKTLFQISKEISKSVTDALKIQQERSTKDIEKLSLRVEERLNLINEKVEKRLSKGFEDIDKTFKDIILGVAKISEAQKKIEILSSDVNSLQNVLTDKKSRGIFGEVQLNAILSSIFGDKRDLYDLQYSFNSGVIVDAIIKAPEPLGIISIDSKFPLENYTKMMEDAKFKTEFKQNIKKHVNDIAQKYIIKGITADIAVMFLPAEAIFAEINAYHEDLIDYARKKGVWIASPTTLMALLTTVMAVVRDIKTQEQAKKIQEELLKLSDNFKRYKQRWENLAKRIDLVNKDVKDITTTTNKISNEFERIEKVEFNEPPQLP
jgi:DNA recombination protein RmuC